mmetsp:Transcript_21331/g.43288  ORF Transcript_21331/g.43288 Transcript_21331/m.43288 type:complete len:209 (+) Transcript_21331:361-987(+)
MLHLGRPQPEAREVVEHVRVHDREVACHDASVVQVRCVWLEAFCVAHDLRGRGGRHWGDEQRVADASALDLVLQCRPVPAVRGRDPPHVELQNPFARRRPGKGGVRPLFDGKQLAGAHGGEVDRLEDRHVQLPRTLAFKRQPQHEEDVGEALDADADGPVPHVAPLRLHHRIAVDVNDLVEVSRDDTHNLKEEVVVEGAVGEEAREAD